MGFSKARVKYIHLVKLLSALRAVLQHSSHSRIAVNIGVFALHVIVLSRFKGQILISFHQLRVHFPSAGALEAVQNIFLSRQSVTIFNKNFLNNVLNVLNSNLGGLFVLKVFNNLVSKAFREVKIIPAHLNSGLKNCLSDFIPVKLSFSAIAFSNSLYSTKIRFPSNFFSNSVNHNKRTLLIKIGPQHLVAKPVANTDYTLHTVSRQQLFLKKENDKKSRN